jgi:hypothetical protein
MNSPVAIYIGGSHWLRKGEKVFIRFFNVIGQIPRGSHLPPYVPDTTVTAEALAEAGVRLPPLESLKVGDCV